MSVSRTVFRLLREQPNQRGGEEEEEEEEDEEEWADSSCGRADTSHCAQTHRKQPMLTR